MISEKLQNSINTQINAEMWSSNLYLSMSYYLGHAGFPGCAHWMQKQSAEELEHAQRLADYMLSRGEHPKVSAIAAVPEKWDDVNSLFRHALQHEQHVSELINKLYKQALNEEDYATQDMLMWFVREQVEEEQNVQEIIDKLSRCTCGCCLLKIDNELAKR